MCGNGRQIAWRIMRARRAMVTRQNREIARNALFAAAAGFTGPSPRVRRAASPMTQTVVRQTSASASPQKLNETNPHVEIVFHAELQLDWSTSFPHQPGSADRRFLLWPLADADRQLASAGLLTDMELTPVCRTANQLGWRACLLSNCAHLTLIRSRTSPATSTGSAMSSLAARTGRFR